MTLVIQSKNSQDRKAEEAAIFVGPKDRQVVCSSHSG
jgi:hypothetical protein